MLQALRSRTGLVFVSLVGGGTLLLTIEKAADWGILQHLALVLYSGSLALIGVKVLAGLRAQHLEGLKRHREVRGLERMMARTGLVQDESDLPSRSSPRPERSRIRSTRPLRFRTRLRELVEPPPWPPARSTSQSRRLAQQNSSPTSSRVEWWAPARSSTSIR